MALRGRTERMQQLQNAGGHPIKIDLAVPLSIEASVSSIIVENGGVDILVNAAGAALYGSVEETPMAEARRLFEVNGCT
ncbi:SDR family NAD(P)-dependent oxidoreductase [Paraburkholderia sp. SIMBA_030]|uniref:SDR family NAD(P)-dependent oxidoreductase n=1 Tax=Paraburkholderia sp. SIMBA_030 TaxID=3085773 RepID=UPI00397AEE94